MIISIAGNHEIDGAWHAIGPLLQKACDRIPSDLNVADLWQMCRSGNAFLLYALDGSEIKMASVWQFRQYPGGTILKCLCLGGQGNADWLEPAQNKVFEMAREGGAKRIIYEGRRGWEKLFPQSKETARVYEIEV